MVATLALIGPLIGLLLGIALRRMFRPSRRVILVALGIALAVAAGAVVMSAQYPGPAMKYLEGTAGWAIREWFIAPSIAFLLALPSLIALSGAAVPQEKYKGVITGGLAAYGSMPPLVLVLLFVGCNHAGACL